MLVRTALFGLIFSLTAPLAWAETLAKTYPVKDFSEFASGGNARIELVQDGTEYLRIEADAEVMKRIKVDQTGARVSVWVKSEGGFFDWFKHGNEPVRIVVRVKNLNYLEISGGAHARVGDLQGGKFHLNASGAANADFATINAAQLTLELSGAGNARIDAVNSQAQKFDLSGASNVDIKTPSNTQELWVSASGASNFRGKQLTAKKADLDASGASHIEAAVTDSLTADASGASSVDYFGSPQATTEASGASHVNAHSLD